jgi:FkbM family methyltransferase
MAFFRIIIKFFSFLYFFSRFYDFRLSYLLAHYHVTFKAANTVKRKGKYLIFTGSGNKIPLASSYIYREELRSLITVLNDKNVKVAENTETGGKLMLMVQGIHLQVGSVSNMFTVYEIFLEKLYDLSTPSASNVILDIGMNVGYASLFFASSRQTSHVYSFEPFPGTFKEAVDNISLNQDLKKRITPYNFGISNRNEVVEVPMMESGSAVASTSNLFIENGKLESGQNIRVEVRNITDVLKEIIQRHAQEQIFLKVDCEGEEYAIMREINGKDIMNQIAGFFIEWHIKGPYELVQILNANGFTSLHLPRVGVDSGMIYAFK